MEYIGGKQTRTKRVLLQMVNGVNPPLLMHSDVHTKEPVIYSPLVLLDPFLRRI